MERPKFEDIQSGEEFNRWYWLKEEMIEICRRSALPTKGRKFDLRDRIVFALDNDGALKPEPKKKKTKSDFNWSRSKLQLDTVITDNISFGPNFRGFMKKQIGNKFSCHGDFMAWVRSNEGKTLLDAVEKWKALEARKKDPEFKRDIADNNMYNQYIRDFVSSNPGYTLEKVRSIWLKKRSMPTQGGFVRYEASDLKLDSLVT